MNWLHFVEAKINDNWTLYCPATNWEWHRTSGYGSSQSLLMMFQTQEGISQMLRIGQASGMGTGGWDQREHPVANSSGRTMTRSWPQGLSAGTGQQRMLLETVQLYSMGFTSWDVLTQILNEKGVSKYGTLACDLHYWVACIATACQSMKACTWTVDTPWEHRRKITYCGSKVSSTGWICYPSNGAWHFMMLGPVAIYLIHL